MKPKKFPSYAQVFLTITVLIALGLVTAFGVFVAGVMLMDWIAWVLK